MTMSLNPARQHLLIRMENQGNSHFLYLPSETNIIQVPKVHRSTFINRIPFLSCPNGQKSFRNGNILHQFSEQSTDAVNTLPGLFTVSPSYNPHGQFTERSLRRKDCHSASPDAFLLSQGFPFIEWDMSITFKFSAYSQCSFPLFFSPPSFLVSPTPA